MKIKHLFLALMVFSLAFVSCKKDENKPQGDNRKPIAMRNASGEIVSLVDIDKLSTQLQATKGVGDKYVVESIEVVDKTDEEPYYFIFNYIDVEEEKSYSAAFIGDYVEELANYFYMSQDFIDGNIGFKGADNQAHKFVNGSEVNPEPDYDPKGFWVNCGGTGCINGTCKAKHFRCRDCEDVDPNNPGVCNFAGLGWGTQLIVPVLISIGRAILGI